jgi:transposase-like protein
LKAGKSVSEVAADLGLSTQTIYNWRRQEQIDSGLRPGMSSTDHAELMPRVVGSPSSSPSSRTLGGPPRCCGSRCPQKAL